MRKVAKKLDKLEMIEELVNKNQSINEDQQLKLSQKHHMVSQVEEIIAIYKLYLGENKIESPKMVQSKSTQPAKHDSKTNITLRSVD